MSPTQQSVRGSQLYHGIETCGETGGALQSVMDMDRPIDIAKQKYLPESIDVKIKQLYTAAVTGGGYCSGRGRWFAFVLFSS